MLRQLLLVYICLRVALPAPSIPMNHSGVNAHPGLTAVEALFHVSFCFGHQTGSANYFPIWSGQGTESSCAI